MPLQDQDFTVFVGHDGKFGNPAEYTSKTQIDVLTSQIKHSGKQSVSLYFHGGLVGRNSGLEGARAFALSMETTNSYPVCFIWETDILTILKERLYTIDESPFFKKVLAKALKKFAERYVPAIASRGSRSQISDEWVKKEMAKEIPFATWSDLNQINSRSLIQDNEYERGEFDVTEEIANELEMELAYDPEMDLLIQKYNSPEEDPNGSRSLLSFGPTIFRIAKIVWRVIKRFYFDRDHGFYPTIVEEVLREFYVGEIGSEVWDLMKAKAEHMWNSKDNNSVAAYFMDSLIRNSDPEAPLKINLIGHSAGAFTVLQGYRAFYNKNYSHWFKEIIFIAPACRFELMDKVVSNLNGLQGRWSLFALSDQREQDDVMVPILYPKSLLYFVSGLLENNGDGYDEFIVGMQRFWKDTGVFPNEKSIKAIKKIFTSSANGVVFSPTLEAVNGRKTDGHRHGEIDNEKNTVDSIQFLISN